MLRRLGELREFIALELMFEALNVGAMATRGANGKGIVTDSSRSEDGHASHFVAVSTSVKAAYKIAHDAELPKVLGAVVGIEKSPVKGKQVWQLKTLYADNPSTMMVLLATALSRWGVIVPDTSVSPAVSAVIKRYYEMYKGDPTRVKQCFDRDMSFEETRDYKEAPWRWAAYLGPVPGFNLDAVIKAGDDAVASATDPTNPPVKDEKRTRAWIRIVGEQGFGAAFADPDKTGRKAVEASDFSAMLRNARHGFDDSDKLLLSLMRALGAGEKTRARKIALDWYADNKTHVNDLFKDDVTWTEHGVNLLTDPDA